MKIRSLNPLNWSKRNTVEGPYNLNVDAVNPGSGFLGWLGFSTSKSGETVNRYTALDVTAVLCACRTISEDVAQMPQMVKRRSFRNGRDYWEAVPDHWVNRLLNERPNSWQTPFEFVEGMLFNAALEGSSIALKVTVDGDPRVRELIPIPAGAWGVTQRTDSTLEYNIKLLNGQLIKRDSSGVFHLRGPSLDGYKGLPAIQKAREALGLSLALEKQQARLAGSGGTPSGILKVSESLSPETVKQVKEDWQAAYGAGGVGGIAVLDAGGDFKPISMSLVDSQHVESRRFQIEEIARAFRVLPIMLMSADKTATYASSEQMFRVHVLYSLRPWAVRWEHTCKRDLLADEADLFVDVDERALIRGDFTAQADINSKALGVGGGHGWMTVNEIRTEQGLNPIDEEWANKVPQGAMEKVSETPQNAPSPE